MLSFDFIYKWHQHSSAFINMNFFHDSLITCKYPFLYYTQFILITEKTKYLLVRLLFRDHSSVLDISWHIILRYLEKTWIKENAYRLDMYLVFVCQHVIVSMWNLCVENYNQFIISEETTSEVCHVLKRFSLLAYFPGFLTAGCFIMKGS